VTKNHKTKKQHTKKIMRGGENTGFIKPMAYLVFNLIERGGNAAVRELGRILHVETDSTDIKELVSNLNKALEDPQTKQELATFLVNMGDKILIATEALGPPLQKAIDKVLDIFDRGAKRVIQVATSAGLEAATALPVIGSVMGGVIVLDDMVKLGEAAISAALGTTTTAVEAASDVRNNIIEKTTELANEHKNTGIEMSDLRGLKERGQARLSQTISGLQNTDSIIQNSAEKLGSLKSTAMGAAATAVNPDTILKNTQVLNKQALTASKGLTKELPFGQRMAANTALSAASMGANVTAMGANYAAKKITANK